MLDVRLIGACVLALFVSGVAFGQSPKPPDIGASGAADQRAATDKRGTDEVPFAVKILPAPDAQTKSAEEERERKKKAASDDALVEWTHGLFWATVALACVALAQAGLFVWQLFLMRKGAEDARIAAVAAKESADSIKRSERARIFIQVAEDTSRPRLRSQELGELPIVRVTAVNHGKTAASITRVNAHLMASANPPTEVPTSEWPVIAQGFGIAPGPPGYEFRAKLARETFKPDNDFDAGILWYCYGEFHYADIFGDAHITSFCWECYMGGVFQFSAQSTLNYQT